MHPLRENRKAQGLTQAQLAKKSRVPQTTISCIETRSSDGRPQTLRKLGKALGLADWRTLWMEKRNAPR